MRAFGQELRLSTAEGSGILDQDLRMRSSLLMKQIKLLWTSDWVEDLHENYSACSNTD